MPLAIFKRTRRNVWFLFSTQSGSEGGGRLYAGHRRGFLFLLRGLSRLRFSTFLSLDSLHDQVTRDGVGTSGRCFRDPRPWLERGPNGPLIPSHHLKRASAPLPQVSSFLPRCPANAAKKIPLPSSPEFSLSSGKIWGALFPCTAHFAILPMEKKKTGWLGEELGYTGTPRRGPGCPFAACQAVGSRDLLLLRDSWEDAGGGPLAKADAPWPAGRFFAFLSNPLPQMYCGRYLATESSGFCCS